MDIQPLNMYAPIKTKTETTTRDPQLWSVCQEFETLFAQQLLKAMTSTLESGFFGESAGSSIYQEMYEQELAKAMSNSGGIGLAEILYKQMSAGQTATEAEKAEKAETVETEAKDASAAGNGVVSE